MNGWILLFIAILFEAMGTISMKLSDGFSKLEPSILMLVFYVSSLVALNFSLKKVEVSTAYAVWSGVGLLIVASVGFVAFGEKISVLKIGAIALIITGVVLLYLVSGKS